MTLLTGTRVVELASVLAGPSVGMFLAELGAEVVKIEPPGKGDVTRSWKLPTEDPDSPVSAYFASCNAGKLHRFIDWRTPEGSNEVRQLILQADILLTNFRDFTSVDSWLRPEALFAENSRLIYCQLDGYESEPGRSAYDVVLQAETGYMSMNGTPESGPVKMPLAFMDLITAHQMKQAILLSLYQREKTGVGSLIRASLERSALAGIANQSTNWLMAGHVAKPMGSLHPNIAPYGETFTCSDGQPIVLAVGNDRHFEKLCALLGHVEWSRNERYSTNKARVIHRDALARDLAPAFLTKPAGVWSDLLKSESIPAGEIRSMDQVHDNPIAREMVWKEDMEGHPTERLSSLGFKISSAEDFSRS